VKEPTSLNDRQAAKCVQHLEVTNNSQILFGNISARCGERRRTRYNNLKSFRWRCTPYDDKECEEEEEQKQQQKQKQKQSSSCGVLALVLK
jgi:hypothetical protein